MSQYLVKIAVSAVLVVLIAEIGKRSTLAGAILASLPVVSLLAMVWLYADTKDALQVAALARSIFWLVLPSLVLFLVLPAMLERGYGFYSSLTLAAAATVLAYAATMASLRWLDVRM